MKTFHEKTLEDLGDYEDGSNLSSPQNGENLTGSNLSPLKLENLEQEKGETKFGFTSSEAPTVQGFKK